MSQPTDNKKTMVTILVTEREIMTKILKMYKNSPCLWDSSNKFYFNKKVKAECFETMLEVWQQLEPDGTVASLKKKLEHFRAAYRREWNKVTNSIANGATPETVHKPTLWYYNLLTFLNVKQDGSKDSSEEENEIFVHLPLAKRKRQASQTEHSSKGEKRPHLASPSTNTKEDYVNTYGLTIAKQLKELDDEVRYEAERIISDVIYRARTGTLPKYSPQAVDLIIPQSGPSWYDVPVVDQVNTDPTPCLVVTVTDPSEQFIKTELDDTIEYTSNFL